MAIKADLQLLANREAIKELTAKHARAVVKSLGREVGGTYAEDGRFTAGNIDIVGRTAIQDYLAV